MVTAKEQLLDEEWLHELVLRSQTVTNGQSAVLGNGLHRPPDNTQLHVRSAYNATKHPVKLPLHYVYTLVHAIILLTVLDFIH